jgi:hypothetical protein
VLVEEQVFKHVHISVTLIPVVDIIAAQGHKGELWQRVCALKLLFGGQLFQLLQIDLSTSASSHPQSIFHPLL